MQLTHVTPASALTVPLRAPARFLAVLGSIGRRWAQAQRAQQMAEQYLLLSDEALAEHGTSRAAVIEQIRRIATKVD